MLSKSSEYGLKAMTQLGREPDRYFSVPQLAKLTGASRTYLNKVMAKIAQAGLVHSETGPGRGFRLTRPARQIRLEEIIDAVEPETDIMRCYVGLGDCGDDNHCPFHHHYRVFRDKVLKDLKKKSLRDILDSPWT